MKRLRAALIWTALGAAAVAVALAQAVVPSNLQYNWPAVATTGQLGSFIVLNGLNAPRPANYRVDWTVSGTAPSPCTFNVQGSSDNVTWTNLDGGSAVSCATSGGEVINSNPVLMLRVNVASYAAGDGTTKVTFRYTGSSSGNSSAVPAGWICTGSGTSQVCTAPGTLAAPTVVATTVTVNGTPTNPTDAATVAYVGSHGGSVNGQAITPSLVTVNNQALGTATALQPFLNGGAGFSPKLIMMSGDSTTAISYPALTGLCNRSGPGQELAGILCAANSTYSTDGSKNVTVVVLNTLPVNCTVGAYVTIDGTATFASNAVGSATPTFQITAVTTNSFTYNNPLGAASIGSTAANGLSSCSIINNGLNGQTQAGFNAGSGVGSLGFTISESPDLDIHVMGINDVRGGATSLAALEASIKAYIDSVRTNSTKTAILLATPNSLQSNDSSAAAYVTSPSTTTTNAVASTGSQTITLASMPTGISGLISPGLGLADEVANTTPVTVTATTGSITAGSASLSVASATGFTQGMVITVAGAGAAGGTLTTQIQTISGTTFTVAPQAATTATTQAVAESGTVYSGHLLVDSGANQEIVPITAISGSTVTATFALTHASGVAVIATMPTMAQAYTNILHDAVMSFEGVYPNVQVADTQSHVYGRLVQPGLTWLMINQLHPSAHGYNARSTYLANAINKDNLAGGSHTQKAVAGIPDFSFGRVAQYSPLLAQNAMNQNYTSPWLWYSQVVEDPDYFTLVGEGVVASYVSTSFIRIGGELDTQVTGGSYGVIPCQGGDLVEFVGFGTVQLSTTTTCTTFSTGGNTVGTATSAAPTIPYVLSAPALARIYRAKYVDATAETYARQPAVYRSTRYVRVTNSSTTGFIVIVLAADPSFSESPWANTFNPATDKLVVQGIGDLSTIIGSYSSMTCSYNTPNNAWVCTGGTGVPTMASAYGQAFYATQNSEQLARGFQGTKYVMTPLLETAPPSSATNAAGNNQTLQCGQGSGTGAVCQTILNGPALGTASGTTFHTQVVRAVWNDTKNLTSGAATTLVSTPLATLQGTGGNVAYHLRGTDGTSTCVLDGVVAYSAENSAGVFVTNASNLGTAATACTSGGSLSATFAVTSANPALLQITPTLTGITATTFTIVYEIHAMGETNVTP